MRIGAGVVAGLRLPNQRRQAAGRVGGEGYAEEIQADKFFFCDETFAHAYRLPLNPGLVRSVISTRSHSITAEFSPRFEMSRIDHVAPL